MRVVPIPFGAKILDTDTKLTPAMIKALLALVDAQGRPLGIAGFGRYVSIGSPSKMDLDPDEVKAITDAGAGVYGIQHVRYGGWLPSAQMGVQDGHAAASNMAYASLLSGCTCACDLEGVAPGSDPSLTSDWANGWWTSAQAFTPELYVGDQNNLNAAQLFALRFHLYWGSGSIVPTPAHRGFWKWQVPPLDQTLATPLGPFKYDLNIVGRDRLGGFGNWQVA